MAYHVADVIRGVPEAYRNDGLSGIIRGGIRYGRERLPTELWPPLCLDPKSKAAERIEVFESEPVNVQYAGNAESLPTQLAAYNRRISGPEGAVYRFEDTRIVGPNQVIDSDGRYFLPSWFGVETPFFVHQKKFLRRNVPLSHVVNDKVGNTATDQCIESGFVLLSERGTGFHHWFYEVLPKLYWFEQYKKETGDRPVLLTSSPLKSYQKQSLELMGYDSSDWIEHAGGIMSVENLLLAPHPIRLKGNQLQALSNQLEWVGNRILSRLSADSMQFADKIYISRDDATRRRVSNKGEVMRLLSGMGFQQYEPGRYSLAEQAQLFSGANIIVGPHGLAFTNLLYARDSTLVELFPEGGATETYFVATNELDISYEFIECDAVSHGENTRPRDKDLDVDIESLETVLSSVMESRVAL